MKHISGLRVGCHKTLTFFCPYPYRDLKNIMNGLSVGCHSSVMVLSISPPGA